jgi:hypothetical protein
MFKLTTKNGIWTVTDGQRSFETAESAVALGYILTMLRTRRQKCTTPTCYPVRSLVPHPKKRRLTAKQREFVKAYKAANINYEI